VDRSATGRLVNIDLQLDAPPDRVADRAAALAATGDRGARAAARNSGPAGPVLAT